jgi:imidazolonepropionase-like amidohydrolase
MNRSPEAQLLDDRLEARFAAMVKPMHDTGIRIVAGSDCGPSNSYVYPGASMIGELEALVALGGLTPAQALEASVVNGPAFLGLSDFYGSISPGKVSDLLILDDNPLEDISNIRSLNLVIVKGNIIAAQKLLK